MNSKVLWVLVSAALITISCVGNHKPEPPNAERSVAQVSGDYCIALRGNGDLEPAHWGALAQTIEKFGLPTAMAGGSSASISMFLLDSIAANPSANTNEERAFMLKSLVGFFVELKQTPLWTDVEKLYGAYRDYSDNTLLVNLQKAIEQNDLATALKVYKQATQSGVLDPDTTDSILHAFKDHNFNQAKFLISEIRESAKVFGKFNAETDANLFFRGGIVNFQKAAELFGKIAGFYSAQSSSKLTDEWKTFLNSCAANTENMLWQEIAAKRPECAKSLGTMFKNYFASTSSKVKPEDQIIGKRFAVFPSTSVFVGNGVKDFKLAKSQYRQKMDSHYGKHFTLSNPEDLRFGYWGQTADLKKIDQSLDKTDEKARRFYALGPATWKQVLALSPAEPGLSPLKEFRTFNGKVLVSAGGWSDLHPVQVLRAAGCGKVVYVTRKGGESLFAQGVAKRLMGLDRSFEQLRKASENKGQDSSDMHSTWSKLYNLANPNSSINQALIKADAVLCTDWNSYSVKTQGAQLIEESYKAPWLNQSQDFVAGCTPKK